MSLFIYSCYNMQALRYTNGKIDWTLIDFNSLRPMVDVLEFGAKKYARDNWKNDMPKNIILPSLLRHVIALASGEEVDPESGLPHIGHIMCNAMFYSYHHTIKKENASTIQKIDGDGSSSV